jgi:hypothetical protein
MTLVSNSSVFAKFVSVDFATIRYLSLQPPSSTTSLNLPSLSLSPSFLLVEHAHPPPFLHLIASFTAMPKKDSIDAITAAHQDDTVDGKHKPFTKAQNVVIESYLPEWRNFAFVKHPDVGGRGQSGKLTKWKQDQAIEILRHPAFIKLPEGVSLNSAQSAIVQTLPLARLQTNSDCNRSEIHKLQKCSQGEV